MPSRLHSKAATLSFCLILTVSLMACSRLAANDYTRKIRGGVDITDEHVTAASPRQSARVVFVTDFALDSDTFKGDQGVRGMALARAQQGALSQLGPRLRRSTGRGAAAERSTTTPAEP